MKTSQTGGTEFFLQLKPTTSDTFGWKQAPKR